ncbi:serine protease filzig [Condylostylus longicornis]|uniref:serine protease filzig n=1 Tax=Condylostylus longicornis TaxID=2530218 RepID=UPI00244E2DDE|nr:serine protease filzig [Condylostylus longicornis]XP_055379607.1 serine protease filzig [Condylostylus longicornis]
MFNHECAQRNGEVVGACMDGFLFGACCQVPGIVDTTLIQNAQKPRPQVSSAYESYGSQQATSSEQGPTGSFYDSAAELDIDESAQQENVYTNTNHIDSNQNHNLNSNKNNNSSNKNKIQNQFYVEKESVTVSSPSSPPPLQISTQDSYLPIQSVTKVEPYLPPSLQSKPNNDRISSFSTELPMKISSLYGNNPNPSIGISSTLRPPYQTPTQSPQKIDPNNILANGEFTHSDITHPAAESVLIENDANNYEDQVFSNGYGPSTVYLAQSQATRTPPTTRTPEISTLVEIKVTHKKPVFKPKPIGISTTTRKPIENGNQYEYENYSTESNSQKQTSKRPMTEDTFTTNNMASIESIILMLNDSNPGPSYNWYNGTTEATKVNLQSSYGTQKPPFYNTNSVNLDKYGENNHYYAPRPETYQLGSSTHTPITTPQPVITTGSGVVISGDQDVPSSTLKPPINPHVTATSATRRPPAKITTTELAPQKLDSEILTSTIRPVIITSSGTRRPTVTAHKKRPTLPSSTTAQQTTHSTSKPNTYNVISQSSHDNYNNEIIITPTRRPGIKYPLQSTVTRKPPSTSYVTGPTPPRHPSTQSYVGVSTLVNRISTVVSGEVNSDSTGSVNYPGAESQHEIPTSTYGTLQNVEQSDPMDKYKIPIHEISNDAPNTLKPHPTVLITPKPTPTSSIKYPTTSVPQSQKLPSTSYVFSPIVTKRPDFLTSTADYVNLPPVTSNDFDDPGYYDGGINTNRPAYTPQAQQTSNLLYYSTTKPIDERPSFPGYYVPSSTPSYSTFGNLPTAVVDKTEEEEETFTSPNDFVNFPPVRHPNLNMSAISTSVTNDLYMSTPAFIQDDALKNKMNLLVSKIVESLQGNFEALAHLVEDDNITFPSSITRSTARPKLPSRPTLLKKPQTFPTAKTTRVTTKKPQTSRPATQLVRISTTKSTKITKRPTVITKKPITVVTQLTTTKKPLTRKPQTTTKKPKPTRRVPTTTTQEPQENEIIEENQEENEIEEEDSDEGARKFQCGVRPHIKSGRIVGGKGATFGEWPWQVLVRESTWLGLFTKNKCGGVLITNKFVMTAAHCQPGFLASLVAVFGEFDISGDLEAKRSVTKNVKRIVVHRQYDAATFENDLALLELESPINYDTHIVPICMPPDTADFTGRMATVTGWGRLKYGGGVPSVLQEVQVPVIENSVCQEMFHTAGHNKKILPSFLCAGYANGQKDSCEGDSGGPLVLQRPDGRWELVGTVSHGIKCAAPYLPGVYMRTTYYKPWLKQVTGVK